MIRGCLAALTAVMLLCSGSTYAAMENLTFTGECPPGSAAGNWVVTVLICDGDPIGVIGIDCDGTAWKEEYDIYVPTSGGGFTEYDVNNDHVSVTSSEAADLQLIDLRTGETVGQAEITGIEGGTAVIDISTLGTGVYGVIVTQNGNDVEMYPFAIQ